jgi:hypothetical protein
VIDREKDSVKVKLKRVKNGFPNPVLQMILDISDIPS